LHRIINFGANKLTKDFKFNERYTGHEN